VLAVGSGVGLIACAAWLISAASLQPHIAALTVAIVGVRVFDPHEGGVALFGAARLSDVAFRMLATIRCVSSPRWKPLSPGALPIYHRGDLLARMVSDVDGLQDLPLRSYNRWLSQPEPPPWLWVIVATLLPSSAAVLAATLAVAAVAAPAATSWPSTCRGPFGQRASRTVDECRHATERESRPGRLWCCPQHLAELRALDARLTQIARSSALAAGVGAALAAVLCRERGVGRARPWHIRRTCWRFNGVMLAVVGLDSACGLRGRADPSGCDPRV